MLDRVYKYVVESEDGTINWNSPPSKVGINHHKIRGIDWPQTIRWRDYDAVTDLQYLRNRENLNLVAIKEIR